MNEIVTVEAGVPRPVRQTYQVIDPVPILDTARFEHMQRIAGIMARCSLVPEALASQDMPFEQAQANCFLAVNQAVRWDMDPFAVAQCMSVVKGKLCFEGKLIAAVIESKLGIKLQYEWNNQNGDALGIKISGKFPNEILTRSVEGTVKDWKTTNSGSPWATQPRKQLAYRGAREWARLHAPGIVLGVYSDDEMEDLSHASRSSRATDVSPNRRIAPSPSAPMIEAKPEPPVEQRPAEHAAPQPTEKPQERRRAPSPTSAPPKQETPPEAAVYDPEKVRAAFAAAAAASDDRADLNGAWEQHVGVYWDDIPEGHPDRSDLDRLYRQHAARVDGEEGATP